MRVKRKIFMQWLIELMVILEAQATNTNLFIY